MTELVNRREAVLAPASSARGRVEWIDEARGIAILLVVIGHTWRGLHSGGLIHSPALYESVDRAIYLFHMPVFFVLSGLTFSKSVDGKPVAEFLRSRVMRLLYPLVLWTYVFLLFRYVAGGAANTRTDLSDLVRLPLPPFGFMWFLWALFVLHVVVYFCLRLPSTRRGSVLLLAALGLGAWPALLALPAYHAYLFHALLYLPAFLVGMALAPWVDRGVRPVEGALAALVFVATQVLAATTHWGLAGLAGVGLLAALSFVAAIVFLSGRWTGTRTSSVLGFLGIASMAIYLSHVLFSAAFRIALQRLGIVDVAPHLLIGTLAGVVGPVGLFLAARRLGASRWLGF